jgi:hypothetical protein
MLTEKGPEIGSSEITVQSDNDNINSHNAEDKGDDIRYRVALMDSDEASDPESLTFNPNGEDIKKVRWKVDKRLIPLLAVMYLCSFLDRANIGKWLFL